MKYIPLFYLLGINILAAGITLLDQYRAKRNRWRVKERTLLVVSLLGGAVGMFLTMKGIRHKTQKRKFMWGLPLIFVIQLLIFGACVYIYYYR